MAKRTTSAATTIAARVAGAAIGGGGTYAVLRLTDAWGLGHNLASVIAAGMALAGLVLGPVVWRAVIELA